MTATMTQIRDQHTDENGNVSNRWAITVDGDIIAELHTDIATDEIVWVEVNEAHQGEGLATDLYRAASAERTIYHSPAQHRTPEGDRWAQRVGGPSMPDCQTCLSGEYH